MKQFSTWKHVFSPSHNFGLIMILNQGSLDWINRNHWFGDQTMQINLWYFVRDFPDKLINTCIVWVDIVLTPVSPLDFWRADLVARAVSRRTSWNAWIPASIPMTRHLVSQTFQCSVWENQSRFGVNDLPKGVTICFSKIKWKNAAKEMKLTVFLWWRLNGNLPTCFFLCIWCFPSLWSPRETGIVGTSDEFRRRRNWVVFDEFKMRTEP